MPMDVRESKAVEETGLLQKELLQRKQAEEAHRAVVEHSLQGLAIVQDFRLVFANQAFAEISGYTIEELLSLLPKEVKALVHPEDQPLVWGRFRDRLAGKPVPPRYEYRGIQKDGTVRWLEMFANRIEYLGKPAVQAAIVDITERKQAEEEVRRRSEELTALNAIAMTVTSTLDLQEVLRTIQERVVTLLSEKYPPFFSLFDEANQTLEVVVTGTPKKILARAEKLMGVKLEELIFPLSTVNPAVREALLAGKPYVTDDVSDLLGPRVSKRLVQGAQSALGIKSIVDLPLCVKGKFVGIMALLSQKEKVSDEEMDLLSSIASQAAIAIENARLYEQAQARSSYLETLLQINATLRSTLPLSQVLETIVQGATEALDYVGSLITIPDATGDRLVFGASWGGRFVDAVIRLTGFKLESFGLSLKAEENPIVRAYLTGELQTSSGAPERIVVGIEPPVGRRLARAIERTMGAKLAACVPLPVGDKVVGVLSVFSPREQLADEERAMLIGLADQAGLAIQNARLYEELKGELTERKRAEDEMRRRSEELAALNAIAETISGSLDLREVLHRALDKVLEITGFEAGGFGLVDEAREVIVPMVHRGVPQDFLATFAQPRATDGLRWQSVKSGEAIFFENLPHDTRIRGREAFIKGFRAGAYLPLKVKDKSIGLMGLGTGHDHHFSPEEKSLLMTIASQIAIAIENAQAYERLKTLNLETISALAAAVEAKDPYTSGHSEKVTQFAIAIAEKLGLTNDEIEDLRVGALLHDIGKIGIPDSVLNKPARLTSAEFLMIKAHPAIAAEIVGKIEALAHLVPIIRHHHERWDGTGYPDGLKGGDIPLLARILAVADGFEAMTSERPYRRARTEEEALAELQKGAGTQWDPQVAEVFVKTYEEGALEHQASDQ